VSTEAASLAEAVAAAIDYLREMFELTVEPTGNGGAIVTIHGLEIGDKWNPNVIDLTFEIAFNYPFAPIYPYYTLTELSRTDGGGWPSGLQRIDWRGALWTQVSLRATRWNPQMDTAAGAAFQVQQWFRRA